MASPGRVRTADVSLAAAAREAAARYRIPESQLRLARGCPVAIEETADRLVVHATLVDGRPIRISCSRDAPALVLGVSLA